jgi:hypothetical protein
LPSLPVGFIDLQRASSARRLIRTFCGDGGIFPGDAERFLKEDGWSIPSLLVAP